MEMTELGTCLALLYKIQTLVDGGIRVTIDLGAQDSLVAQSLIKQYSENKKAVFVTFVEPAISSP